MAATSVMEIEPAELLGGRPTVSPQVTASPLDDSLVLYHGVSHAGFVLNPTAAWIWTRCDGSRSFTTLAHEFGSEFGLPTPQAVTDLNELVHALRTAKLLELD